MISYLEGTLIEKDSSSVIISVHGVGYRVFVSGVLLENCLKNTQYALYVHYVARETSVELYGFLTFEELHFFEKLIGVSGVGPKTALLICSSGTLEKLKGALARGDAGLFKAVSGVGPKTAERIVIELRDKMGKEDLGSDYTKDQDITDALVALGYLAQDVRETLKKIDPSSDNEQERLKAALKLLGGRK